MSLETPPSTQESEERTLAEWHELDYYERLSVSRDASQAEIQQAFRALSQKYHPDVSGQDTAEIMKYLSQAYAELKKPESRARYDALHPAKGDSVTEEMLRNKRREDERFMSEAEALVRQKGNIFERVVEGLVRKFSNLERLDTRNVRRAGFGEDEEDKAA